MLNLNPFKLNRLLKQVKHHVQTINGLNDDLIAVAEQQTRIIEQQNETIAALKQELAAKGEKPA